MLIKYTIKLPPYIQISYKNNVLYLKGPKGANSLPLLKNLNIYIKDDLIFIVLKKKSLNNKNLLLQKKYLKTFYTLFLNKIKGVTLGYFNILKLVGLGYKVKIKQDSLIFVLGYSHKIKIKIPQDLFVFCTTPTQIVFFSFDKILMNLFIHKIKKLKKKDPYKGKGILFLNEKTKLKEGKKN